MGTSEKQEGTMEDSGFKNKFGRYLVPRKWMMPSLWSGEESLKLNDSSVINLVDDETKLEISLNTAGYQPSELSVNVGDGELVIEGRHEERSQTGEMMVSRQFRRQYGLPPHTKLNPGHQQPLQGRRPPHHHSQDTSHHQSGQE